MQGALRAAADFGQCAQDDADAAAAFLHRQPDRSHLAEHDVRRTGRQRLFHRVSAQRATQPAAFLLERTDPGQVQKDVPS
jgi:hypothetical protein